MSGYSDDASRPAKRARIDDNSTPTFAADASAPAPQEQPIPSAPAAIDTDLEREVRAGITEYVCPDNLGFTGVLKQRYTDFLVNEIGLDGQVLHLRSTEVEGKKDDKPVEKVNATKSTEEAKPVEAGAKEEKDDADMQDAGVAGETTLPVPVTVQDEPKDADNDGEQILGQVAAPKQEPEETLADEDRETLQSIFGQQTTDDIIKLVTQVRKRESKKAKDFKPVISPPITDKDMRTQAHKSLRRMFPNLLESAMENDQTIRIKATPPAERKKKKGKGGGGRDREDQGRRRGGLDWEELGGEYLHFNLYKENKDTMEVVGFLGSKLNCGAKGFGFAGTKDRRACTVQRVCVKRQTAQRMQSFNRMLFNAAVGDFEYRHNDLKLGDLMGNEFTITLRDCHFQSEEGLDFEQRQKLANDVVRKAITDFSSRGFINYYGLQRFGSFAASTDAIGRKMLQDDLQGAVEDLLAYSDVALAAADGTSTDPSIQVSQDDRNRAKALHIWKTKGSGSEALDFLPRKFTAERNIIQHLSSRNSKTGRHDRRGDWQGALMTIPRTLRLMYVHAYQSLVWNTVAGQRWAAHGDRVVEGDLVLVHEHTDKQTTSSFTTTKETDTPLDQDGEMIINPSGTENANAAAANFERARALSAAEAASGLYTIWDVVLPQPGFDVEYPSNAIGAFYKTFMGSEKGGGLDPYNMRRTWREVSLSGGYRKFLAKPLGPLGFEVHAYRGVDDQFVETDMQRLGRERDVGVRNGGGERGERGEKGEGVKDAGKEVEDGEAKEEEERKLAVVLTLQLASSQYATIALRELMKAGGVRAYKPEFMGGR